MALGPTSDARDAYFMQPPPGPPSMEFGQPSWVKEIRISSHNNHAIALWDIISEDPDDSN